MTSRLRSWFLGRSRREQAGIVVAAVLLVLTIAVYGIIRPIGDALDSAITRHADAVDRVAQTEAKLASLSQMQGARGATVTGPLEAMIRDRAATAGFALANVVPQTNNVVQITIPSARPSALFGWIAELEAAGVLVDSLTTRDNGDQTLSVQLAVKTRGK